MARLVLQRVFKTYHGDVEAVRGVDLVVEDREFLILLGPSGCGKTTVLRMVAGLENVTSGTIELDGKVLNDVPERDRDIAMVFQNYALYPHMSVYRNIAFPLRHRGVPKEERDREVRRVTATLGLTDYLDKRPAQLSGGQRQRVAMGRAMVRQPKAFLMDEPLSNLDAALRVQMRTEIHELQRRLGVTTMYVTHDQVEAMTLGDRVAVMRDGIVQQLGTPDQVYERPANTFVAHFMGSPGMTMFRCRMEGDGGSRVIRFGDRPVELDRRELAAQPGVAGYSSRDVIVGVRPEAIFLGEHAHPGRQVRGRVEFQEVLGSSVVAFFRVDGDHGIDRDHGPTSANDTDEAPLGSSDGVLTPGRFAAATRFTTGDVVELELEEGALRFFDPETGAAI